VSEKIFRDDPGDRWAPRIYKSSGRTYTPVAPEDRKIGVNKPDDPRAVRFYGRWLLPLPLIDDEQRVMPETKPDDLAYEHMSIRGRLCSCEVCRRPEAERYRRRWRREQGLRA
jgi:hypothetical protein